MNKLLRRVFFRCSQADESLDAAPGFARWTGLFVLGLAIAGGCSRGGEESSEEADPPVATDAAAEATTSEAPRSSRPGQLPIPRFTGGRTPAGEAVAGESGDRPDPAAGPSLPRVAPPVRMTATDAATEAAESESTPAPIAPASGLQLPPGNAPEDLKSFLRMADREIERLGSGRGENRERAAVVAELQRVAELKQQAAERLLDVPELEPEDEAVGIRARMQALSHKAALGDLPAAGTLEQYAIELLNHPVDDIARDSRSVLIGFALERLQGGVTDEPDEVLRFVAELASRPELLDASSLMAMQRAMMVLTQYGYDEAAETVRGQIASAFADLDDPQLSLLAGEVLAAARFDDLELMRRDIATAGGTSPDQWKAKASEVAAAAPDMMSLRYLASLALQMESMALDDEAAAIYDAIEQHLAKAADAEVADAAREALRAHQARRTAIGQPVAITASQDLSGAPLALEDFRGRVVLMPFWAVEDPASIDALAGLEALAAEFGEAVAMVGVNMDVSPAGRERATSLARRSMPWPSIAAADSGGTSYSSELARRLGVVSLPTVVVLDREGKVTSVALSHPAVEAAIRKSLAE